MPHTKDHAEDPGWAEEAPRYRERWEQHGRTERWEDVEPGYKVGHELRTEYAGRPWAEVEPEFRTRWSDHHSDKPWDRFLDKAQDVWDDMMREPGASPHAGERGSHDEASGR